MSITCKTNRKNSSGEQCSVLNTVVRRSAVEKDTPFITEDRIPAGEYRSTVVGVHDAFNSKGKPALDIVYALMDASNTRRYAKERLNMESFMLETLIEHWLDVGQLDESSTYSDIMGIEETVKVVYKCPGGLGTLQERKPRKGKASSETATKVVTSKEKAPVDDEEYLEDILPLEDDD